MPRQACISPSGFPTAIRFPAGYPVADLVRQAAAMRVNVEPLAPCYADPAAAPPGLLLGYANLTESQINAGVQALARAARLRGTTGSSHSACGLRAAAEA